MPGKELFKLFGLIGMHGVEGVEQDLKKIDKQARKVQRQIDKFGKSITKTGKTLTKAFTVPLLGASVAIVKGIGHARDLNETMTKTGEVFGAATKDVVEWSKNSATALGQSKKDALDAAAGFGIVGKAAGFTGKELVKFSTDFVKLSSDMASFYNTEPAQAVTAIGAAFRGEQEPIRKYGVLLDDATMRQKALELGIISSLKTALTPQNKILAAQALIMEKSKVVHGDFLKTAAGLANQQRILKAEIVNVSGALGQVFLPIALKVMTLIREGVVPAVESLTEWFKNLDDGMQNTIIQWGVLLAVVGPVAIVIGKIVSGFKLLIPLYKVLIGQQTLLNFVMNANPIGLVITAIAALVAAGILLANNWDSVTKTMGRVWDDMVHFFFIGGAKLNKLFFNIAGGFLGLIQSITRFIPGLGDAIGAVRAKLNVWIKEQEIHEAQLDKERVATLALRDANDRLAESTKKATATTKKSTTALEQSAIAKAKEIDAAKKAAAAAKKLATDKKQFEEDYLNKLREAVLTKSALLDIEEQEALKRAEQLGADKLNIELFYQAERFKLANEEQQKSFEDAKEERDFKEAQKEDELSDLREVAAERLALAQEWLSFSGSTVNKIGRIQSQFAKNELKRIDIKKDKEIARVNASTLSEEQKAADIIKIEEAADLKSREIQRKQAERQKALAVFNIVVNTAQAAIRAFADLGPVAGAIAAGIITTLGTVQAVAVANEPVPFFDGGLIQGSEGGVNALVGERNQSELVFPLEKGADMLLDKIMQRAQSVSLDAPEQEAPQAVAGGDTVNLNVGTFIGDDRGLKKLYRKLDTIGISENQRKGLVTV